MPLVSVVVPVYKVENYINRCVDSLINQTLKDIEIILVDDGSPDNCPKICDELAKTDERIKIVHKQNGGLSSARNAGMTVATGQYIGFVDSDDDVELDMYEKMITVADSYDVDFVMADYIRVPSNGERFIKTLDIDSGYYGRKKIEKDIFPKLIMRECIDYGPLLSVWHCLYKLDFLKKIKLTFDEEVKWSEDNIFSAIMGYNCNSFYYMKGEGLYHYYNNPGTITTSYKKGAWQVYCTMNDHLHEYFDKVTDYDFSRQLKLHLLYYACHCISKEFMLSKKEAKRGISEILSTDRLKNVFESFELPYDISWRFKVFLLFVKYRQTNLIYYLSRKR